MDEYCIYSVNYTLTLEDAKSNVVVQQVVAGSNACKNGVCSITLLPPFMSSSNQSLYRVKIIAINSLGASNFSFSDAFVCKLFFNSFNSFSKIF